MSRAPLTAYLRRPGTLPATLTVLLLWACIDSGVEPEVCSVQISIVPAEASIEVGDDSPLAAHVTTSCASTELTWESNATDVASVSSTGIVTGVAVGSATITATVRGGATSASATSAVEITPRPVASVRVAPEVLRIRIGMQATLTVTVSAAGGEPLTDRQVTWTSADTTVAEVSASGVVTGLGLGSTIVTATVEGVSASADITIDPARGFAFARADQENAPEYEPNPLYSYNNAGGPITISRDATGSYQVRFGDMADADRAETVMVSAYGAAAVCGVESWRDDGADFLVDVYCDSPSGLDLDTRFSVLVIGQGILGGANGFLWTSLLTADYAPSSSRAWNTEGEAMRVQYDGLAHQVDFGVLNGQGAGAGYFATPYGGTAGICSPSIISFPASEVEFTCLTTGSARTQRHFTALTLQGGRPGLRAGIAFNESPGDDVHVPRATLSYNSSGGGITIQRLATGYWRLEFEGLARKGTGPEIVTVHPFGNTFAACVTEAWVGLGDDLRAWIRCYDSSGDPTDHQFFVLAIE